MTETPPAAHRPPPFWNIPDNPIFRRFCRSRLRARGLSVSLIITLVISGFVFLIFPLTAERLGESYADDIVRMRARGDSPEMIRQMTALRDAMAPREGEAGNPYARTALFPLLIVQGFILFVFGTGQVAGGMTAESDEGSVDYQRLAPVTPLAKTLGYLFGLPVREYVMFLATLPLTAISLWRGAVPASAWLPVYGVFLSSVLLYHSTGLVAGTVLKSKRWAFLVSMGLVFALYTVASQGARFGFPFVRYLTLWPVLVEHADLFAPASATGLRAAMGISEGGGVPFFQYIFQDLAFTFLVQGSFILALLVMVWRKWKRTESHLLSKMWAVLVFAWLQTLIIGNALPMAESGDLFPFRSFQNSENMMNRAMRARQIAAGLPVYSNRMQPPTVWEAAGISGVYALSLVITILILTIIVTPGADSQVRGLRRAFRVGKNRAPPWRDEAGGFPVLALLTGGGVVAWHFFQRALFGSHWFDGKLPGDALSLGGEFRICAVMALTLLAFHALLEARGGKWPFLAVIFLGVVPLMAGMVVMASSRGESSTAIWLAGISPVAQIGYAAMLLGPAESLPKSELVGHIMASSRAWTLIMAVLLLWSWRDLFGVWKRRRATLTATEEKSAAGPPPLPARVG